MNARRGAGGMGSANPIPSTEMLAWQVRYRRRLAVWEEEIQDMLEMVYFRSKEDSSDDGPLTETS